MTAPKPVPVFSNEMRRFFPESFLQSIKAMSPTDFETHVKGVVAQAGPLPAAAEDLLRRAFAGVDAYERRQPIGGAA